MKRSNKFTVPDTEAQQMIKDAMSNGMLLWIHKRAWGNRKKVPKEMLIEKFGKDAKRIRAVQDIVDRAPVRQIIYWQDKATTFAEARSMNWFHRGTLYIWNHYVDEVEQKLKECDGKMKEALKEFKESYPALVDKALTEHLDLYKDVLFPHVDEFDDMFALVWGWQVVTPPMQEGESVGVVSKEVRERENRKFQEYTKACFEKHGEAIRDAFAKIILHLRDKLKDPNAIFHESSIEKPKEFLKKIIDLPAYGDVPFAELAKDAEDILNGVYAEDLRDDKDYRQAMGEALDDVVDVFENLPTVEIERALDI